MEIHQPPNDRPTFSSFLRNLSVDETLAVHDQRYEKLNQEAGGDDDVSCRIELQQLQAAFPGLFEYIEEISTSDTTGELDTGVMGGAIVMLALLQDLVETYELNDIPFTD